VTRVLLLGGSGQLGTAIRREWKDCEIVAPPRSQLGLEQTERVADALDRIRPGVLLNAAAFHDVDRCEEAPEEALAINALAVGRAARLAHERDVVFVTISTDYVFDGAASAPYPESARPNPLSLYGLSKLVGEHLAAAAPRRFVIRTCGLYGARAARDRVPFVERVLGHSAGSEPMRVVDDVFVSPTFAGDLARALRSLIASDAFGLYHAVNPGPVSWYEFAAETLKLSGRPAAIEPIQAAQWKATAIRPRFSALENANLRALGIALPPWQAGIAAYLALR
jgi:dTDP-4-dehydrorhamnose reductase